MNTETNSGTNFSDLIFSLSATAATCLDSLPDREGRDPETLFNQAEEIIKMLICLKEKTQGNLAVEEEALLQDLVFGLQIWYGEKKKEMAEGPVLAGGEFEPGNLPKLDQ
ncbi:MAG: DUF1844 domain-containing protein [bacterium]|nr:DUF1844 domain-containing protein [bacterium]